MTNWSEMTTPERVTAVKAHIALHPKAKEVEIAEAFGASRESLRSVIRYYGIKRTARRKGDDKPKPPKKEKPVKVNRQYGFKFGKPTSDVPVLPRDVDETKFRPLPGGVAPKPLHELGAHECHWPVSMEGPALFCACHAESGRYCTTHTKTSGKMVPRLVIR